MIRLLFSLFRGLKGVPNRQFIKVAVASVAILCFSSSGFLFFEGESKPELGWADAVWWSVVTMTTVGYGDHAPETLGGRYLIGIPTMILGISVLGYLLSVVAGYLIEARSKELKGMENVKLRGHILVVHFQSLSRVQEIVYELRHDEKTCDRPIVLIDDNLDEIPPELQRVGLRFVRGDPTKEATLERASFRTATHAMILARDPQDPRSDDHNLAVSLCLEKLHAALVTVVECIDPGRVELLQKAGCDRVVCIAQLSAKMLVQEVLDPGIGRVMLQLASAADGHQIFLVGLEQQQSWQFGELAQRLSVQGNLALGLQHADEVKLNPEATQPVRHPDLVICMGTKRPKGTPFIV